MRPVAAHIWQYGTGKISGKTAEKIKNDFERLREDLEKLMKGIKAALQASIDLAEYMEKESKKLLLKEICTRAPYGVKCVFHGKNGEIIASTVVKVDIENEMVYHRPDGQDLVYVHNVESGNVNPYLRPLSSMTDEEKEEFRTLIFPEASCAYEDCLEWDAQIIGGGYLQISVEDFSNVMDWFNAHHFDYRGLIEKGLAFEAPEDMYKQ